MKRYLAVSIVSGILFCSCSVHQQLERSAERRILHETTLETAHIGISIFDPARNRYVYDHQGDKYFIPASNVKLATCYAAMKYLGDSLVGLRYKRAGDLTLIEPAADPTFLAADFKHQPVYDFLKKQSHISIWYSDACSQFTPWGKGWTWDDYLEDDMPERSEFPVYGNCATFFMQHDTVQVLPKVFADGLLKPFPERRFTIARKQGNNLFYTSANTKARFTRQKIPFVIRPGEQNARPVYISLLEDTLGVKVDVTGSPDLYAALPNTVHSQPTDSMLKIMMHRSDNFFAEQTLLMLSDQQLHCLSDAKMIDTLLKTDYKELPQPPKWVDGSGLSRYNLFTPKDFVAILSRMKKEFSWNRITTILPTGGDGTLGEPYKDLSGRIYAKTGTLSGQVALSGYLVTRKNKTLIFSVLVNNHQTSAANVRKAVAAFLMKVYEIM